MDTGFSRPLSSGGSGSEGGSDRVAESETQNHWKRQQQQQQQQRPRPAAARRMWLRRSANGHGSRDRVPNGRLSSSLTDLLEPRHSFGAADSSGTSVDFSTLTDSSTHFISMEAMDLRPGPRGQSSRSGIASHGSLLTSVESSNAFGSSIGSRVKLKLKMSSLQLPARFVIDDVFANDGLFLVANGRDLGGDSNAGSGGSSGGSSGKDTAPPEHWQAGDEDNDDGPATGRSRRGDRSRRRTKAAASPPADDGEGGGTGEPWTFNKTALVSLVIVYILRAASFVADNRGPVLKRVRENQLFGTLLGGGDPSNKMAAEAPPSAEQLVYHKLPEGGSIVEMVDAPAPGSPSTRL